MRNSLSEEKIAELVAPFAIADHAQIPDTTTIYLKKSAIRQRLNEVDAGWTLSAPQLLHVADDLIVVTATMTVCGVSRAAVGTGKIQLERWDKEKKQYVPMSLTDITREKSKAFKTAASDLVARCAMQFGVGEYLKNMPKSVRNLQMLEDWLAALTAPAPHWALNGGGERFRALITKLGVKWEMVKAQLEPGRVLERLSDIALSETDAVARLVTLHIEDKIFAAARAAEGRAGVSETPLALSNSSVPTS